MLHWVVALGFLLLATTDAIAQSKRAFIVGIDKYDQLSPQAQLRKAVGDSKALGEALTSLGYIVTVETNATRSRFNERWQGFLDSIKPGDTVAFSFAGHGIEINGSNYLLPRDIPNIRLGRDEQLKRESLSLAELLADLRERKPIFSFVILDACRNNPFAEGTRSIGGTGGLARIEPPEGSFVMFSAGAHQTALDRLSDNDQEPTSVYTRTLIPLLRSPGLSLLEMADRVGEQVRDLAASVSHKQTPAFYSGVVGGRRVCLAGCGASNSPVALASPQAQADPASTIRSCREIEAMASLSALSALERQYAGTPVSNCIAARIAALKSTALPKKAPALPRRTPSDCQDCPAVVPLTAGSFTMGSNSGEQDELPTHRVTFGRAYSIGKTEVTIAQWRLCVLDGVCSDVVQPRGSTSTHPVVNVTWAEARSYTEWLSKKTGKRYRLPSEAEWEFAAQAGGSEAAALSINCRACSGSASGQALPAASSAANSLGLHGMLGNVGEWVLDCKTKDYSNASSSGTAAAEGMCGQRGVRGGSWFHDRSFARPSSRHFEAIDNRTPYIGFRVLRED